ncbi:hypothetical protein FCK90_10580 [Kocuria coralli]|uniref:Uncharacterized protein n=1 Tax=Kocuria coralli TaxID=1461025 RepID=A0A5J5KVY7_9MICC|nr:hypothetical protein [Kocuria coralli]KAA9393849.1 hypothetical protein FCK90_10580 [Kocuria coralli]
MSDPDYDQLAIDAENGLFSPMTGGRTLYGEAARQAGREMVRRALNDEPPTDDDSHGADQI